MPSDTIREQLEKLIPKLLATAPQNFSGTITSKFFYRDGKIVDIEIIHCNEKVKFVKPIAEKLDWMA